MFVEVLNFGVLAPLSWLPLTIRAYLALMGISKSSEFACVSYAVKVGFDYRRFPCTDGCSEKF